MKQTAVEWLFLMMNNPNKDQEFANKLFEKAKAMEKEQIINASYFGHLKKWVDCGVDNSFGEQYYNETFKQKE